MKDRPLRLAMFSPLPPVPSGISDYAVDLLTCLPESWSVDLFVDDGVEPQLGTAAGRCRWFSHRRWHELDLRQPYDANIYQMGNHAAHAYMMPYALERPGLLVLHDAILHPSRVQHAVEGGAVDAYRQAARRCRPDVGRALGHLVAGGLSSPGLLFSFPLCEDLVRGSLVTGVHGELLAGWLRAVVPGGRVVPLAHWASVPEVDGARVEAWRQRLGARDRVLIGSFGYIGRARRLDKVLEALAVLNGTAMNVSGRSKPGRGDRRVDKQAKAGSEGGVRGAANGAARGAKGASLVVVGWVDPDLRLQRLAAELGLADRVHWLGRVDRDDYAALLCAVDVAVNLRWPPARASSAVLNQLLQVGTPTVITDLVHWRDVPDDAVARVPPGPDETEAEALQNRLESWIVDADLRRAAGRSARRWAQAHVGPSRMSESYARVLEAVVAAPGMEVPR